MTNGQLVAQTACELADPPGAIFERGTNTDFGGWIDDAQHFWGMGRGTAIGPQPWCDMGADKIFRQAGVDDSGLCHPSTAETCRRADRMGGLAPQGGLIHPGTLLISCGVHITTVVRDRNNGLLDTVECNSDDRLKRGVRAKSWGRLIEPPGLRDGTAVELFEYWFEDPEFDPEFHGGIDTRARRDKAIATGHDGKFAQADADGLVRRVKDGKDFGFWVFTGGDWKWGPWVGKKEGKAYTTRNVFQHTMERSLNRKLRARSKPIADTEIDFGGSGDETSGKTT